MIKATNRTSRGSKNCLELIVVASIYAIGSRGRTHKNRINRQQTMFYTSQHVAIWQRYGIRFAEYGWSIIVLVALLFSKVMFC